MISAESIGRPRILRNTRSAASLFGRLERFEDRASCCAADHVDLFDRGAAGRRGADHDQPAVVLVAQPLDQAVADHPVDDAGHVGQRGVELVGQPAHRHRAVGGQQEQHVQVGVADRAEAALRRDRLALARDERLELVEALLDERVPR